VKAKYARVVILKHMFAPEEFEKDPGLIIDLKEDIRSESEKLGEVSSVMVFDVRASDPPPYHVLGLTSLCD